MRSPIRVLIFNHVEVVKAANYRLGLRHDFFLSNYFSSGVRNWCLNKLSVFQGEFFVTCINLTSVFIVSSLECC